MGELPAGTVTMLFTDIDGSTALLTRLGERYGNILELSAAITAALGDPLPAARLAGAAEGIRQQSGTLRTDLEEARMERYLTSARATVTPQAWTAELAAGRALTQHEAVILLLSPSPAGSTSA